MKIYDELYRVDIQDWHNWPKALIMVHDYSTNGHDHRKETKRYVPEETFTELNAETLTAKSRAEAARAMHEYEAERARKVTAYAKDNISRLRERVHEIAADSERIKTENEKLKKVAADAWSLFLRHGAVNQWNLSEVDQVREALSKLGIEVEQ